MPDQNIDINEVILDKDFNVCGYVKKICEIPILTVDFIKNTLPFARNLTSLLHQTEKEGIESPGLSVMRVTPIPFN